MSRFRRVLNYKQEVSMLLNLLVSSTGIDTPPRGACDYSDCSLAKIFASQHLRAKEASPHVSSKYPVVVCALFVPHHLLQARPADKFPGS